MNIFRKMLREVNHRNRVRKFMPSGEILDPHRIANRAMYGTDYHPDEVRFREDAALRDMLAMSACKPQCMNEIGKAYEQSLIGGIGILEHKWVNGQMHIDCISPSQYITCKSR